MKFETLAKRLAEKTGTPELEKIILGEGALSDLPTTCMIWTGACDNEFTGYRLRTTYVAKGIIKKQEAVKSCPVPILRWQKKKRLVRRLIFQLLTKADYEYRLVSQCKNHKCVNPLHLEIQNPPSNPDDIPYTTEWDFKAMEELVEMLLTEQTPRNWQDVINAPLMDGVPLDLLEDVLRKLNRRHLLP